MKVGLVGFGSIGFDVGKRIDQGIENFELAGISSRTKENVLKKITSFKLKPEVLELKIYARNQILLLIVHLKLHLKKFYKIVC